MSDAPMTRLFVLTLLLAVPAAAQDAFPVANLDPTLAAGADAVVRLYDHRFDVEDAGRARETVRLAMTVFSDQGRHHGQLALWYDGLRRIEKLRGELQDARGRRIRKLGKSDIEDRSAITSFSLYDDNRVRTATLAHDRYPYTVVFEYELDYRGLVYWPTWYPQWGEEPVEHAAFTVTAPTDVEVRYRIRRPEGTAEALGELAPTVEQSGGRETLRWRVAGLSERTVERYGPPRREQAAAVLVAPSAFRIERSPGDMRSWDRFGFWYEQLATGRDELSPEAAAEVQRIADGAETEREVVRRLYAHLQQTTRYVSVQLGIGGWQPFDADYVHARGYGDCKALTNYMKALLKAAGITAYPALIRSGLDAPEVLADFPSNQFNHVVLHVPKVDGGEPIWLECTSQTMPFGRLGAGNEDRHALVVTPEGGRLVRTPASTAAENAQHRTATVTLGADGSATADVRTRYGGNQQDRARHALARTTAQERDRWLRGQFDVPNVDVIAADFSSAEARVEAIEVAASLRIPRAASRTGRRLFLPLGLADRWTDVPPAVEAREQPIEAAAYPFVDADTVRYELPAGYAVEAAPAPVYLEVPFGRYEAAVTPDDDGVLIYTRRLEVNETRLPASSYEAFRSFFQGVARADAAQVVLVRLD